MAPQILVIEDERDIRTQIFKLLEYEGFQVIEAENGRQGIELAQSRLPDLIVCDVTMPESNGYEVLRELRHLPATAAIPFIFLTARTGKHELRKGMQSGADDYLTKPFEIDELLATIHARLKKHASVQEHASQHMKALRQNLSQSLPHEMRTPLNGIIGFTHFLIRLGPERLPPPAEIIEMLQDILGDAIRLERLVENYLLHANLTMMEADENMSVYSEDIVLCSPSPLLQQTALDKAQTYDREQDLRFELIHDEVLISNTILHKLLSELVDNALKFSIPGTEIKVASSLEQRNFVLSIKDKGRGMSSEQIQQIGAFRQFERKKYEQQGSGLGLRIVQLLARQHQAEMSIHSVPEQGTTVTLCFQEAHPEAAERQHA